MKDEGKGLLGVVMYCLIIRIPKVALISYILFFVFDFFRIFFSHYWDKDMVQVLIFVFYGLTVFGLLFMQVILPMWGVADEVMALRKRKKQQIEGQRANVKRQQELDEEKRRKEKEAYNQRVDVRLSRIIEAFPKESEQILKKYASTVYETFKGTLETDSLKGQVPESKFQPDVKKVDNDERLQIVETELKKLNKFNPDDIRRQSNNGGYWIEDEEFQGVPLHYLTDKMNHLSISLPSIERFYQELGLYQDFHSKAHPYLDKEARIIGAGVKGEERVNEELHMYGKAWNVFSNVRFEVKGQSVESDNIIVSKKGIFTIEAKNYAPNGNYGIRVTRDGQWLKTFKNGETEPMNNIASQSNRHVAYKQNLISEAWEKKHGEAQFFHIQPLIVIANDTVTVENETNMPIIRISQIYHHVMNQPDVLTDEQVEHISQIIEENRLPAKKYPLDCYFPHIEEIHERLAKKAYAIHTLDVMFQEYFRIVKHELELLEKEYGNTG